MYELEVLVDHMEDNPTNYTRFLVLARNPQEVCEPREGGYKTSIVFNLQNKPGVLFKALSVFALRDIDLTKIESRPIPGQLWEYMFFGDFAGHISYPECAKSLRNIEEFEPFLCTMGSSACHHLQGVFENSDS